MLGTMRQNSPQVIVVGYSIDLHDTRVAVQC